jgi:hypothetical protein
MKEIRLMNKFLTSLLAILSISLSTVVIAEQNATPIYQVSDSQGTFIQVPLTHDIYRYTQGANLKNLIVLDAEKTTLPYRLVAITQQEQKKEPKLIVNPLAFFPVAVDATPDTLRKLHTSQVKVQGSSVQIATTDKTLNNKTPEFYLIDISKLDHDITSLIVDWDAQATNQYLEVELEATRNLQDWFSLGNATLVQINQEEQSLKHNHIGAEIAKKEYEFLRLRVLRGAENLHLTGVSAEQKIGSTEIEKVSEAWSLVGQLAKTQTTVYLPNSHSKVYAVASWEFVRDDATPIEKLAIDFGANTYGDSAKLFSRNAENQPWQLIHQGIWFNAQVGNKWQKSDAISVYPNHDKFWRLELNESARNISAPQLVFAWQPTQLQIITNNKPPFVLAIDADKSSSDSREQVFNQILSATTSPQWQAASLIKLNVQPGAIKNTTKKLDWKQWVFWAALLLAVAVLVAFSLKLFKQLKVTGMQ